VEAARSLRRPDRGTLTPGSLADVVVAKAPDYRWLPYHMGISDVRFVIKDGLPV